MQGSTHAATAKQYAVSFPRGGSLYELRRKKDRGILSGTISTADHQHDHISAEGNSYDEARADLDTPIPECQQLIVIRTDT